MAWLLPISHVKSVGFSCGAKVSLPATPPFALRWQQRVFGLLMGNFGFSNQLENALCVCFVFHRLRNPLQLKASINDLGFAGFSESKTVNPGGNIEFDDDWS